MSSERNGQEQEQPQFETLAIREQTERSQFGEHSVPLYLTSSFVFDSAEQMRARFAGEEEGVIYSRYANPNTEEFIRKVCLLEGAEAGFATASGMSAVFTSMAGLLRSGDHILASRAVFGSTHQILTQILPKWGITATYVEPEDVAGWKASLQPNTKLILLETPSNPGLALIDLEAAGKFARAHDLILVVDNCFATPYLQRPIDYGTDLVVHSGTKYMDGQGRVLAGIIAGRADLMQQIEFFARHTGPSLSPFNAWVLSKSLETLAVRMERHCSNALQLAQTLEQHPAIERVRYPFLASYPQHELAKKQMLLGGGIVTIDLKGGIAPSSSLLDNLKMCSISANLGDSRTILTHPATSTHSKLSEAERAAVGIGPGTVRISVGLEHIEDILKDIVQALG